MYSRIGQPAAHLPGGPSPHWLGISFRHHDGNTPTQSCCALSALTLSGGNLDALELVTRSAAGSARRPQYLWITAIGSR
jgi:hypothetical protein